MKMVLATLESRVDVERSGGRLAFVDLYLVVNSRRIVRAGGVYLCGDSDTASRSTRTDHHGGT